MRIARRACTFAFVASGVLGCQRIEPVTPVDSSPKNETPSTFNGAKAGEERAVAGVRLCWCPPGKFIDGQPARRAGTAAGRRPGRGDADQGLLDGQVRGDAGTVEAGHRQAAGRARRRSCPRGTTTRWATSTSPRRRRSAGSSPSSPGNPATCRRGWEFRLPTEAQWEYACRAGTTTATAFGDKLSSKQANFKGKPYNGAEPGPSLGKAAKVGSYPPNAWGLHDMHGNIFEWCRDWYHAKLPGGVDPDLYSAKATAREPSTATSRVRRGGCWTDDGWPCRSAFRLRFEPERRYDHIGFRAVAVRP